MNSMWLLRSGLMTWVYCGYLNFQLCKDLTHPHQHSSKTFVQFRYETHMSSRFLHLNLNSEAFVNQGQNQYHHWGALGVRQRGHISFQTFPYPSPFCPTVDRSPPG